MPFSSTTRTAIMKHTHFETPLLFKLERTARICSPPSQQRYINTGPFFFLLYPYYLRYFITKYNKALVCGTFSKGTPCYCMVFLNLSPYSKPKRPVRMWSGLLVVMYKITSLAFSLLIKCLISSLIM